MAVSTAERRHVRGRLGAGATSDEKYRVVPVALQQRQSAAIRAYRFCEAVGRTCRRPLPLSHGRVAGAGIRSPAGDTAPEAGRGGVRRAARRGGTRGVCARGERGVFRPRLARTTRQQHRSSSRRAPGWRPSRLRSRIGGSGRMPGVIEHFASCELPCVQGRREAARLARLGSSD